MVYVVECLVSVLLEDVKQNLTLDHILELNPTSDKWVWSQKYQALSYKRIEKILEGNKSSNTKIQARNMNIRHLNSPSKG